MSVMTVMGIMSGCGGSGEETVLGPEETVEAFCRAVAAGDMSRARELCDTSAMKSYLDAWNDTWEELYRKDSSALRIASGILSEAVVTVTDVEKAGDVRTVRYTLEADGRTKVRQAALRKEEGEWRVESLTDVL